MDRKNFFQSLAGVFAGLFALLSPSETPAQERREEKKEQQPKKKAASTTVAPKQCSSCVHYSSIDRVNGYCQRYPKVWIGNAPANSPAGWNFPVMGASNICGEYSWEAP